MWPNKAIPPRCYRLLARGSRFFGTAHHQTAQEP
eukprot:CAMPEP_0172641472 /NCGR_PEP_ID=MMETSP1068-20121228/227501_1 /TAXON_ID=35684 /ORGANISM="Pseudopedinella elastica, Strain CCMP716" /LENGTH=33 /DNA_ID= /DNA_START= /DNA_END= /DNA_ORIENTATION=